MNSIFICAYNWVYEYEEDMQISDLEIWKFHFMENKGICFVFSLV